MVLTASMYASNVASKCGTGRRGSVGWASNVPRADFDSSIAAAKVCVNDTANADALALRRRLEHHRRKLR